MGNRWLPLTVLTSAHFFNDFFQYVIPLFLPLLIPEFGLSYLEGGSLVAVYLGSAVALNPIMGHIADSRRKSKVVLCLGLALYGVSVSALQFAQNYPTLLAISLVMGAGFSSYHPQATKVVTKLYKKNTGRFMGLHGIGGGIGFSATPLLLVPLAYTIGWRYAVSFLFIPAIVAALALWIFIKEPETENAKGDSKIVWRPIILLTLISGLSYYVFRGFTTFLPVYFVAVKSTTAIEMGMLTSLYMGTAIVAEPVGGAISDSIGRKRTFIIAAALLTVSLFAFMNTSGPISLIFLVMVGFWNQMTRPVGLLYASELGPPDKTGACVGMFFGGSQGIGLIAALAVGFTADLLGFYWAFMSLVAIAGISVLMSFAMPEIKKKC